MKRWLRHRVHGDDGFTLMELVITVSILGIIVVPLSGVVLAYLRNTVDTQARLTESHDVQFAAAYWQRDVASIGVRDTTYDTTDHSYPLIKSVNVAPCGLPAGASAVVTLAWSEYTSGASPAPTTMVKVTYATRATGGVYELFRVRCGSQPSTLELANSLTDTAHPPAQVDCVQPGGGTACTDGGGEVPTLIKLTLNVHDSSGRNDLPPYTATLSGERRQT